MLAVLEHKNSVFSLEMFKHEIDVFSMCRVQKLLLLYVYLCSMMFTAHDYFKNAMFFS